MVVCLQPAAEKSARSIVRSTLPKQPPSPRGGGCRSGGRPALCHRPNLVRGKMDHRDKPGGDDGRGEGARSWRYCPATRAQRSWPSNLQPRHWRVWSFGTVRSPSRGRSRTGMERYGAQYRTPRFATICAIRSVSLALRYRPRSRISRTYSS